MRGRTYLYLTDKLFFVFLLPFYFTELKIFQLYLRRLTEVSALGSRVIIFHVNFLESNKIITFTPRERTFVNILSAGIRIVSIVHATIRFEVSKMQIYLQYKSSREKNKAFVILYKDRKKRIY